MQAIRYLLGTIAVSTALITSMNCSSTVVNTTGAGGSGAGGSGTAGGSCPDIHVEHRASEPTCATRGPGATAGPGDGQCTGDADCTDGKNGRCLEADTQGPANLYCSYDDCDIDADCPSGKLCECGEPVGQSRTANTCMASNCRVDADCGECGVCSPTVDFTCGDFYGVVGYYCRTPKDTCVVDADCTEDGTYFCAFQPETGRWACSAGFCAG
jgi:hypothetical protein